jgi:hypothetical protein
VKLLRSNGLILTARDIGPVLMELRATKPRPLPLLDEICADDHARLLLRGLLDSGFYERVGT